MKRFTVHFAPLFIPMSRRLETVGALTWALVPVVSPVLCYLFVVYLLLFTSYYYLVVLYYVYYYFDRDIAHKGGRRVQWVRRMICWKWYNEYFPATVVKTCDLPADRNYLLCCYPHGVIALTPCLHLITERTDFARLFPGIKTYISTIDCHFAVPLHRDFVLALGVVPASKRSLMHLMRSPEKGIAVGVIVGGAEEALYAKPGSYKIILKARKGFIKYGLKSGASLVPMFTFGENELYNQLTFQPGSFMHTFQKWVKSKIGITPILFYGRGIFQYTFGILPRRHPLYTIVGEPIDLPMEEEPSDATIERFHALFTEKLLALFEEHKHKYVENADNVHLEIVG